MKTLQFLAAVAIGRSLWNNRINPRMSPAHVSVINELGLSQQCAKTVNDMFTPSERYVVVDWLIYSENACEDLPKITLSLRQQQGFTVCENILRRHDVGIQAWVSSIPSFGPVIQLFTLFYESACWNEAMWSLQWCMNAVDSTRPACIETFTSYITVPPIVFPFDRPHEEWIDLCIFSSR